MSKNFNEFFSQTPVAVLIQAYWSLVDKVMDVFDLSTCSKKVPYLSNIKAQATALLALDGYPIGKISTLCEL